MHRKPLFYVYIVSILCVSNLHYYYMKLCVVMYNNYYAYTIIHMHGHVLYTCANV